MTCGIVWLHCKYKDILLVKSFCIELRIHYDTSMAMLCHLFKVEYTLCILCDKNHNFMSWMISLIVMHIFPKTICDVQQTGTWPFLICRAAGGRWGADDTCPAYVYLMLFQIGEEADVHGYATCCKLTCPKYLLWEEIEVQECVLCCVSSSVIKTYVTHSICVWACDICFNNSTKAGPDILQREVSSKILFVLNLSLHRRWACLSYEACANSVLIWSGCLHDLVMLWNRRYDYFSQQWLGRFQGVGTQKLKKHKNV